MPHPSLLHLVRLDEFSIPYLKDFKYNWVRRFFIGNIPTNSETSKLSGYFVWNATVTLYFTAPLPSCSDSVSWQLFTASKRESRSSVLFSNHPWLVMVHCSNSPLLWARKTSEVSEIVFHYVFSMFRIAKLSAAVPTYTLQWWSHPWIFNLKVPSRLFLAMRSRAHPKRKQTPTNVAITDIGDTIANPRQWHK